MTAATEALNARVLVLNKAWKPVGVVDVQRAMGLFVSGAAKALDANSQMFDFDSWAALSAELGSDDVLHSAKLAVKVPRILVLQVFDKLPRTQVRFSRQNIYARDSFTCQYCGQHLPRAKLNLDHVMPKSQGGRTSWTNVVTSCITCNVTKGGRTPEQAGMKLLSKPVKPDWHQVTPLRGRRVPYEEWRPFLDPVSAAYWNANLVDD